MTNAEEYFFEQMKDPEFKESFYREKIKLDLAKDFFNERLKKVSREEFKQILTEVPDVEPQKYDKL